jgi:hypothetical protein
MQFIAGIWQIILSGHNGRINQLTVKDDLGNTIEEVEGKFIGIAPPQAPHKVDFSEPAQGSRIHFARQDGATFVSPPITDASVWLERSYASMFNIGRD